MRKNLLTLDLQHFADEIENAGENDVEEPATSQEEESEADETETVEEEDGNDEPQEQSAEDNARYAAIRRRAEEDARKKYEALNYTRNQQIAAMCQGITHPVTGRPITNVDEYMDALSVQQKQARENELREAGIDPAIIDQAVAQNPVVMQAQQVIEQNKMMAAENALQNDIAEVCRLDPTIKNINDLAAMPYFPEILDRVNRGERLVDAFKIASYGTTSDAARQKAINEMRGKSHLASQPNGVATENDDVEVPAEIMSSWKAQGKTEKQIRDLYKTVASKLHLN